MSAIDELTELAYSKFASYYSSKNWVCNYPLYSQLSEKDKEFWKAFISNIRINFSLLNNETEASTNEEE